jgi:hypothetical protein
LGPGDTVELATLDDYAAFGPGWAYQDEAGIWTQGTRSELALALDGTGANDCVLVLSLGSICVGSNASLRVEALVDGERVAVRDFDYGDPEWRFELPAPVPADGAVELTLGIENPNSPLELGWSGDDRRFGLLLSGVALEEVDRSLPPDERVVFSEGLGAERFLGKGWSRLESTGVWTDGERARLVLRLTDCIPKNAEIVLNVAPFVTPDHPVVEVDASASGKQLTTQVFRHGKVPRLLRVRLPELAENRGGRIVLELTVRVPARPVDLGLGDDARRLGVQLRWLMVRRRTWRATLSDAAHVTAAKLRRQRAD